MRKSVIVSILGSPVSIWRTESNDPLSQKRVARSLGSTLISPGEPTPLSHFTLTAPLATTFQMTQQSPQMFK